MFDDLQTLTFPYVAPVDVVKEWMINEVLYACLAETSVWGGD